MDTHILRHTDTHCSSTCMQINILTFTNTHTYLGDSHTTYSAHEHKYAHTDTHTHTLITHTQYTHIIVFSL